MNMLLRREYLAPLLLAFCLFFHACAARVGYRVYDPDYRDYHVWSGPEPGYYHEWVVETHRPEGDFRKLRAEDQHAYFKWRHEHHPEK
jgi:hypothetical protein